MFEQLNLKVVGCGKGLKHPIVKWTDPENWVDWEERFDFYPDSEDFYVIPGQKVTYDMNGVDVGYYVLDIDRGHKEGDEVKYAQAIELLRSWKIPRTLTVRTAHGGLHIYYKSLAGMMPAQRSDSDLPIEIKSANGWVAPNGKTRKIIVDTDVAMLVPTNGTPFGDFVNVKKKSVFRPKPRKENFNIENYKPPVVEAGYRHNTLLGWVTFLKEQGATEEELDIFIRKFCEANPGRVYTERELSDIKSWLPPEV